MRRVSGSVAVRPRVQGAGGRQPQRLTAPVLCIHLGHGGHAGRVVSHDGPDALEIQGLRLVVGRAAGEQKQQDEHRELIDRYSGCLDTGGDLGSQVEGLREEWR